MNTSHYSVWDKKRPCSLNYLLISERILDLSISVNTSRARRCTYETGAAAFPKG